MKLWRVISPFFNIIGVIICYTCIPTAFSQTKEPKIPSKGELDQISQYYSLSKQDTLSIPLRLDYINSFLKVAYSYEDDSLIYNGLMRKTWLLGKAKQYDSAIIYSKNLHDYAHKKYNTKYIIKALTKLGIYYRKNSQLAEAFQSYNSMFKTFRQQNDSINAGRSLHYMADIQKSLGDYQGCKTTAIEGLKYLENTSDVKNLSGLYHIISVANREQKNYEEALKYNDKALEIETSFRGTQIFNNTRANIFSNQGNYTMAINILSELMKNDLVQKNRMEYARVLSNLGHIKWMANNQNLESRNLLLESLKIRKEIRDIEGLIASNIHLTKYYLKTDKTKALEYAEAAYQNALELKSLTSIIEALGFIFDLKENVTKEAKVFSDTYLKLNEINQSNREIYAVTKYENENLTNRNLKLEAANAKLAIEKAKEERENIIYLLGTVILILSGGFIFYLLQQRYKREKIREVYNAETRISKKLHDELANDVYNVMIQVQNEKNDDIVLDKLEDIYNRTRDISREHSNIDTGRYYALELNNMLSSYSSYNTTIIIKGLGEINWQAITHEKKVIIHRVLQELMINMKKHSEAEFVAVSFKRESKKIIINYSDNGVGVSKEDIFYSNGLRNVENRIKTIGGLFIFETDKGSGFKAKIEFPS